MESWSLHQCLWLLHPHPEIQGGGKQDDVNGFPFDIVAVDTPYSLRMYLAYAWGLTILDELNLSALH